MAETKPLAGVRVVDFSNYVAGPGAARALADLGAEVIKVESPKRDSFRAFSENTCNIYDSQENPLYELENANKLGMAVNTKSEEGLAIMGKLLETADVFISNVRLGSLERMGLGYEAVHEKYPKVVWAHISGYGNQGEESFKPGFDITAYWARSGALLDTAERDTYPNISPYGAGDHGVSLATVTGILAALFQQRQTGEGSKVETSLIGTAIYNYSLLVISTQYGDQWPKSRFEPANPLNAAYRCSDGEWFMLTAIEYERYRDIIFNALGLENLVGDERFTTLKGVQDAGLSGELTKILDGVFATKTRPEWVEIFNAADVPSEMVRHFYEVKDDPQGWANGYLSEYTFRNGNKATFPALPITFDKPEAPAMTLAPTLGEHNDEVLAKLGYSEDEIKKMYDDGVIVREAN